PLVEDLLVAVLALAGVVLRLPVLLVGGRVGRRLLGDVRRRLRDAVRQVQPVRGRPVDEGAHTQRGEEDRGELERLHSRSPPTCWWAIPRLAGRWPCVCSCSSSSARRTGSLTGTRGRPASARPTTR